MKKELLFVYAFLLIPFASASTVWLLQDQQYTIGSHIVTVGDVDALETKCGLIVDGAIEWVDVGSTQVYGDLSLSVVDAISVNSEAYDDDTCELELNIIPPPAIEEPTESSQT